MESLTIEILDKKAKAIFRENIVMLPPGYNGLDGMRMRKRHPEYVMCRIQMIKFLRDEHKWSFPRMARLLERDHATIMYLYRKTKEE